MKSKILSAIVQLGVSNVFWHFVINFQSCITFLLYFFSVFFKLHGSSTWLNLLVDDDHLGNKSKSMKTTFNHYWVSDTLKKSLKALLQENCFAHFWEGGLDMYALLHLWLTIGTSLSKGAHSSLTPNNNILIINKIKFPSTQKEKKNPTTKLKLWSYCVCSCFNEPSIPTPQVGKMGKEW